MFNLIHRTLVHAFPEAGLGVALANDGVLYETDVLAASNFHPYNITRVGSPKKSQSISSAWGGRPVLILVGIRLGIDGVNPVYYDYIKVSLHSTYGDVSEASYISSYAMIKHLNIC